MVNLWIAAAPAASIDAGQKIYLKTGCYTCHGRDGQGSTSTGPRLGPSPLALAGFTQYVREPRGNMPPYSSKVLTDQQLADIHAFLRSRAAALSVDGLLPPPPK